MVTTATHYLLDRNRATPGLGYDGVVRVSSGGFYGTGVLLYDGRAILTSAHLFGHGGSSATIFFATAAGETSRTGSQIAVHPEYDPVNGNNDLALVWLSGSAPIAAERSTLHRDNEEVGRTMTMVGFGIPGTGDSGVDAGYSGDILRLKAENTFDADVAALTAQLGSSLGWSPLAGSQLLADFDNGSLTNDALGRLLGLQHSGLGLDEGLISSGDSGGPAFIEGKIAGVASYTASLHRDGIDPDIDTEGNSSYGEIAAWQRVSHYQQWIDQSLRARAVNAPTTPAEVEKQVVEGSSEATTIAYFMLQFTGVRSIPNEILSVDYTTRNGTAAAGEDYLPTSGTLKLYPGESQATILVEIIGDATPEADETFYLDVFNPVGGSFGEDVVQLTAVRTIVNDDGVS